MEYKRLQDKIKEYFELLEKSKGEVIRVEYVEYRRVSAEEGVLNHFVPYHNLEVGKTGIPFIGYGAAIRKVTHDGKVLYENPFIPENYDLRDDGEIYALMSLCYGKKEAGKLRI